MCVCLRMHMGRHECMRARTPEGWGTVEAGPGTVSSTRCRVRVKEHVMTSVSLPSSVGSVFEFSPSFPEPGSVPSPPRPWPIAPWAAVEPLGSLLAVWPRFLLQLRRLCCQLRLPGLPRVPGASCPAVSVLGSPWSRTRFRPFLGRILLVTFCPLAALSLAYWRVS